MDEATKKAGRLPEEVALVAVTKTYPVECAIAAVDAGVLLLGENKVQEGISKKVEFAGIRPDYQPDWHLIGHLQSNKASKAVRNFDLIHSVDGVALAREIQKHAAGLGKIQRVLIQVNGSEEASKSGLEFDDVAEALGEILETCPHVLVEGFMTMAQISEDPEETRPVFRRLRKLRDDLKNRFAGAEGFRPVHLSMGMTQDFPIAIEEGATLVRVGTAIFGQRAYSVGSGG